MFCWRLCEVLTDATMCAISSADGVAQSRQGRCWLVVASACWCPEVICAATMTEACLVHAAARCTTAGLLPPCMLWAGQTGWAIRCAVSVADDSIPASAGNLVHACHRGPVWPMGLSWYPVVHEQPSVWVCQAMWSLISVQSWHVAAGDHAKMFVDEWIDACAAVINLRTAIMRYRKPRSNARFHRQAATVWSCSRA